MESDLRAHSPRLLITKIISIALLLLALGFGASKVVHSAFTGADASPMVSASDVAASPLGTPIPADDVVAAGAIGVCAVAMLGCIALFAVTVFRHRHLTRAVTATLPRPPLTVIAVAARDRIPSLGLTDLSLSRT